MITETINIVQEIALIYYGMQIGRLEVYFEEKKEKIVGCTWYVDHDEYLVGYITKENYQKNKDLHFDTRLYQIMNEECPIIENGATVEEMLNACKKYGSNFLFITTEKSCRYGPIGIVYLSDLKKLRAA